MTVLSPKHFGGEVGRDQPAAFPDMCDRRETGLTGSGRKLEHDVASSWASSRITNRRYWVLVEDGSAELCYSHPVCTSTSVTLFQDAQGVRTG